MNTPQQHVDQRNELYEIYRQARNEYTRNSTRKSHLRERDPGKFTLLKCRYLSAEERLEAVERLAINVCSEFGLKLCGICTPHAHIGQERQARVKQPAMVIPYSSKR